MIKDNILLKLNDMKGSVTPVESRIVDVILSNPEEVIGMSIKELAQKSSTSDASVLRFSKALGFASYRNFSVSLSAAVAAQGKGQDSYTDIRPGDELDTIISNVFYNDMQAIQATEQVLNKEEIKKAVDYLCEAKRIDFYGIGASGICCLDAEQKFMRIHQFCRAYTEGHTQLTAATLVSSEDVCIFVSYSGMTVDILEAARIASQNGAKIIAITKCSKSPLVTLADAVLYVSTPEITIRSGAMGSRIAMLAVIDVLFSAVASRNYDKIKEYLIHTHDIIAEKKKMG